MKKTNNKGYTLALVVVIVALISIMATTVLAVTSVNIRMKAIQKQSLDNFYNAETAMDEIKVGLQNDVAVASKNAYLRTMKRFEMEDEHSLFLLYQEDYKDELVKIIAGTEGNADVIKDHLMSFVSKPDEVVLENIDVLIRENAGVRIPQLQLVYTDLKNYQSIITTDIMLGCPDISFSAATDEPDLKNFCLVGQKNINFTSANRVNVSGNILAGKDPTASDFNPVLSGLEISDGADVVFQQGTVIAEDGIWINGGLMQADSKTTIWTDGINVNGGGQDRGLITNGRIYSAGDLEASGNAYVSISGQYYGFGNPIAFSSSNNLKTKLVSEGKTSAADFSNYVLNDNPAQYSSSIVMNTLGTENMVPSIDMSHGLTQLFLAGNAYVSSKNSNGSGNGTSVLMGESISAKGNQVAYFVPNTCMNTPYKNPSILNLTLPISSYYDQSKLAEYMLRYGVTGNYYVTTKKDANTGVVYFFINFNQAKTASTFYRNYYNTDDHKSKLDSYIEKYVKEIKISNSTKTDKVLNGNFIVCTDGGIYTLPDTITEKAGSTATDLSDALKYRMTCTNWADRFIAETANLSITVSEDQIQNRVFYNMIKRSFIDSMPADSQMIYTAGEKKVLVVNGDYKENTVLSSGNPYSIIIANGDVELWNNFEGIIIASGGITVNMKDPNPKIISNPELILDLIDSAEDASNNKLRDVFNVSAAYTTGITNDDSGDLKVSDYVVFENWKKE